MGPWTSFFVPGLDNGGEFVCFAAMMDLAPDEGVIPLRNFSINQNHSMPYTHILSLGAYVNGEPEDGSHPVGSRSRALRADDPRACFKRYMNWDA